jgi:hypothetical protein
MSSAELCPVFSCLRSPLAAQGSKIRFDTLEGSESPFEGGYISGGEADGCGC